MMQIRAIQGVFGLGLTFSIMTGCTLPPNQAKPENTIQPHAKNWIGSQIQNDRIEQGLTAYLALDDAFLSIASRLHLIRNAQHSLDLQYYIWKTIPLGI